MRHISLTGKLWTDPAIVAAPLPGVTVASLLASRTLGDGHGEWTGAGAYPQSTQAIKRLSDAFEREELIGIIGDYDCDGLTSTAILTRFLRRHNAEPIVRIPHRLREGYGVQRLHIDEMHSHGVTLLFTVDTGIVATDALRSAHERGIDVIVLDHHAYEELPPAYAVLHPKQTALESPPSAAGVVFAFVSAFERGAWDDRATDLALAMIGTVADVVPLTHENRMLTQEGLRALAMLDPTSALGVLRDTSGCGRLPSSIDIAFRLAPRLNAAGRIDDATIGLRALLGDVASVDILETLNAERQKITRACLDEALDMIDHAALPGCVCVASERFPKGIIGLIAGKLSERFGRPAAAIAIENGLCTASLRGIASYDIATALRKHAHLFTTFGGHAQAGGCSFAHTNLHAVQEALDRDVRESMDIDALHPTLTIDATLSPDHISLALVEVLRSLEPFGCANPEPMFLLPSVTLTGIRRVGGDARHLQAKVGAIGIIGFGLGHLSDALTGNLDLACRVTANVWNGERRVQLSLVDVREALSSRGQTGANLPSISNTAITGTLRAEAIL